MLCSVLVPSVVYQGRVVNNQATMAVDRTDVLEFLQGVQVYRRAEAYSPISLFSNSRWALDKLHPLDTSPSDGS